MVFPCDVALAKWPVWATGAKGRAAISLSDSRDQANMIMHDTYAHPKKTRAHHTIEGATDPGKDMRCGRGGDEEGEGGEEGAFTHASVQH